MDMPITIPANFADSVVGSVKDWSTDIKVADVSDFISVLKETWDLQTFENLQAGRIAVPDDVINQTLADAIAGSDQVKALKVTSLEDNKIRIDALSSKSGHILLICKITQFEHDKNHSVIKLKALDKRLPDKPLLSWIFSRVSLAMVTKITGNINPGHGVAVSIYGNEATIDFHQALNASKLGQAEVFGYKPLDYLIVRDALPEKNHVLFNTSLDLPDNIGAMVKNALSSNM